jgi:hypothetical protein
MMYCEEVANVVNWDKSKNICCNKENSHFYYQNLSKFSSRLEKFNLIHASELGGYTDPFIVSIMNLCVDFL